MWLPRNHGERILIGFVLLAAAAFISRIYANAAQVASESAMRALLSEICIAITKCERMNGDCPRSLGDLFVRFPDGSSIADISRLRYSTESGNCVAEWTNAHGQIFRC
jgi:hypothetical protein